MMSILRKAPVLLGLVAAFAATSAQAEDLTSISTMNYLPASSETRTQFTCVGSTAKDPDVSVVFETRSTGPAERSSRLKSVSARGQVLEAGMLGEVNAVVGKDSLVAATAGCSGKDIRIVLSVFRPDNIGPEGGMDAAHDYLYIYLDGKTGKLRFE